jgi:hypothetical protein
MHGPHHSGYDDAVTVPVIAIGLADACDDAVMLRRLPSVVILLGAAHAEPAPSAGWDTRPYLSPGLFLTTGSWGKVLPGETRPTDAGGVGVRVAIGAQLEQRREGLRFHAGLTLLGATTMFSGLRIDTAFHAMGGVGLEFQADHPVGTGQRIGARVGWETTSGSTHDLSGSLLSFGGRYYPSDDVWLGLDVFRFAPHRSATACGTPAEGAGDCALKATGLLLGVGLEGRAGTRVGIGIGVVAVLGFLALARQAH